MVAQLLENILQELDNTDVDNGTTVPADQQEVASPTPAETVSPGQSVTPPTVTRDDAEPESAARVGFRNLFNPAVPTR